MKSKASTFIISLLIANCILGQNINNGLVAYYPLNGNLKDESGNGYTANGSQIKYGGDDQGKPNSCIFNGNAFIQIPDEVLNGLSQGSITAKIKISISNTQHTIIDKTITGRTNYFQFIVDNNDKLRVIFNDKYFRGQTKLLIDSFYQVACTFDGIFLKLYVNNILDGKFYCNEAVYPTKQRTYIGKVDNNMAYFKGSIADVRIYNRCVSDDEIVQLNGSLTKIISTNETASQPLDENTVQSETSNNNTIDIVQNFKDVLGLFRGLVKSSGSSSDNNSSDYEIINKSSAIISVFVADGSNIDIYSDGKEDDYKKYYSSVVSKDGFYKKSFDDSRDDNSISLYYFGDERHYPLTISVTYPSKGKVVSGTIKIYNPQKEYQIKIFPDL